MKLVTSQEMRELDRRTIEEIGIPGAVLMENAGRGAAQHLVSRFEGLRPGPVLVLCGKGNNGGDGYVIARHLMNWGWRARVVVLAGAGDISGDAALHLRALRNSGGDLHFAPTEAELAPALAEQDRPSLIVDALLGTGLTSEVRGLYGFAIDWLNASRARVLAVDVPSGVDATSGRILGRAVRADLTVTFAFAKTGLVVFPAANKVGELVTVDIGIPAILADGIGDVHRLVDAGEASRLLPPRPATGHKGTFGHLLVVAGSPGKSGAAVMSAEGGLRGGAGLVTACCPASIHQILETRLTEAMTAPLPEVEGALSLQALEPILQLAQSKDALALGPGLGQGAETFALVRRLLGETPLPMVLDADGLNALGEKPVILNRRPPGRTVLTPHPGEMARLIGGTVQQVEGDRIAVARDFARRYQVVLVLKGARTVVALPDGRVRINGSGNSGLASGGTGDVLTGLIGALLAQGAPSEDAAVLGVYLHGLAADRLSRSMGEAGMTATDLLQELPFARDELARLARRTTEQGDDDA